MKDTVNPSQVTAMLRTAAGQIRARHQLLTDLDSVTGDGDHGTAMLRSMDALEQTMDAMPEAELKEVLAKSGWAVMSAAGGSTGPLLGTFFIGMGASLGEAGQLDGAALSAMIRRGVTEMQKHTQARIGDKTMMDALLPAVATLEQHDESTPPARLLQLAAESAALGAEQTKDMLAKFGRARNLGDRVLGHADPGATSMALILAGFAEALNES
ncbi:MAG: dihydroxyacetone kinase subunit L [Akkermansiaceae bacterium]|nr:dihydroxyacetone kinase subunit L [Akkermansiaceae bacterium]MCF7730347.1 dihydroxyacetone kinase subunit L [Akkermansiaceae bacterium]